MTYLAWRYCILNLVVAGRRGCVLFHLNHAFFNSNKVPDGDSQEITLAFYLCLEGNAVNFAI